MGIKLLPPSEKINNSQNFYPILKNNISFQSLNTGNHDLLDFFGEKNIFWPFLGVEILKNGLNEHLLAFNQMRAHQKNAQKYFLRQVMELWFSIAQNIGQIKIEKP